MNGNEIRLPAIEAETLSELVLHFETRGIAYHVTLIKNEWVLTVTGY